MNHWTVERGANRLSLWSGFCRIFFRWGVVFVRLPRSFSCPRKGLAPLRRLGHATNASSRSLPCRGVGLGGTVVHRSVRDLVVA